MVDSRQVSGEKAENGKPETSWIPAGVYPGVMSEY
jgi:hypothetical protein